MSEHLDLADWRRRVAGMYAAVRSGRGSPAERLAAFRRSKDELFRTHPQSPIPAGDRPSFTGLAYWRLDPALRFSSRLEPDPDARGTELPRSGEGTMGFRRIGWVRFRLDDVERRLAVYWIEGYAGGIFLPFRDPTNGTSSYGGGRYLWDSIKGADLGSDGEALVIDFNYAYHPSCVYDTRWSCPLAPQENWLPVPIRAGERLR